VSSPPPHRDELFERLYAEHAGPLLAFLVYRTGDRALAEDLLADTFERVLTTRRGFDRRRATEKTWLYTIALNLLRDHARRTAVHHRAMEHVAVGERARPVPGVESVDERDSLHRALERLSDEEREAVALRYGADLTVPEMAKLTGQKLTTTEGRLYRALRKLKEELG
jgi:RNA polymerase sigma-70 factor (ECF subfamily)